MVSKIEVYLASPRGFCAGVERAIETVKLSLARYGKPVYVLHEIVHNKHVIVQLEEAGAVFVENLQDIPSGEVCIFSAHGVSRAIEERAGKLGLRTSTQPVPWWQCPPDGRKISLPGLRCHYYRPPWSSRG